MADEKDTKEYIVREGRTFGTKAVPAGESVFLTDAEAEAFADLVEPAVKPRKGKDQNEDTRDEATNEKNIGNKSGDKGTPREAASSKK